VVLGSEIYLYGAGEGGDRVLILCSDCLQMRNSQIYGRWTVGNGGNALSCRVTTTGFPGGKKEGEIWLLKAMDVVEKI
jgi:hypothetical protein